MAGVSLIYIFNYGFFFVFLLLFYIWKFYAATQLKSFKEHKHLAWDTVLGPNIRYLSFYLFWQLLLLFTSKTHKKIYSLAFMNLTLFTLILIAALMCYMLFLVLAKRFTLENEIHLNGCIWILFTMIVFVIVDNFISFLLMVELISTIYFFFVLVFMKSKTLTLIKLKNLISNFLWISFFTLVLFFIGLLFITRDCGTLTFKELYRVSAFSEFYVWQVILIALLWKIGGPGFYFFKLELYQYLPTNSLIVFSIISAFTSCFLLHFMFANCWPIFVNHQLGLIFYLTVYNCILLIRGLKNTTFYQFLALSAINTWSVLLLFYLI